MSVSPHAGRPGRLVSSALPREGMLRHASVLISGTVGGQLAVLVSSPLLTRLYGPADFGALAVYSAILAAVTLVASLRYELAVPLPGDVGTATALLVLSMGVLGGTTLLTLGIVQVFGDWVAAVAKTPQLSSLMWLLPVGVLAGGGYKLLTYWALRERDFGRLARTRLQQGVGMAVAQVGFGMIGVGAIGLLIGHIVGVGAGLLNLSGAVGRSVRESFRTLRLVDLKEVALRYRDFAMFSTWSDVANVIGAQAPFLVFATRFSPSVAGLYLLAHRVANAPALLVSEAVGKAFMRSAVDARARGELPALALSVFTALVRLGTGPLLIVAPFMPGLFDWGFGNPWRDAGRYVQLIVPVMACVVVFAPLSSLFAVLERQRAELLFQVVLLVARVSALLIGASVGGPMRAVLYYSVGSAAVYSAFGAWLLLTAGVGPRQLAASAARELAVAAVLGACAFAISAVLPRATASGGRWAVLVAASGVCVLLAISGNRVVKGLRELREASGGLEER